MFQIINAAATTIAKTSAFDRFVKLLEDADSKKSGCLRVLTYHSIDEPARCPWLDPGLISASPKEFDQQMAYLTSHYQVITTSNLLAYVKSPKNNDLPPRAVLVTFDDGYCDFEEYAWPVLMRHGIPAVLFVPTAYPDHPEQIFWWDSLYQAIQNTNRTGDLNTPIGTFSLSNVPSRNKAYQQFKAYIKSLNHSEALAIVKEFCIELDVQPVANSVMSWASLRKMSRAGLTLGAHTRTHPLINRISLQEARDEVVGSLHDLKREIGDALPIFAYPSGEFSDEVVRMLELEGFVLAFSTKRGINDIARMNPLRLQRINVGRKTTLPILRSQLLSWTVHLNRLRSALEA